MIETMDYATIISAKRMKGSGLSAGQEVMVVGTRMLPQKRSDPYLLRLYVIVVLLDDATKFPLIPNGVNEHKSWLVDPRNLEKFPLEKQQLYQKMAEKVNDTTG